MELEQPGNAAPESDRCDLEFPDWSGMDDSSRRISVDAAFKLVDQYPKWFPEAFRRCLANRRSPCPVEFEL